MITPYSDGAPMRWLDVPKQLAHGGGSRRAALHATSERVTDVIGSLGAFRKGVVEGR